MSSILPKGIVVNTEEISDDINPGEGQPVPVDQIARMWKVYTATHRRLLDPTAERLENYWWRIWGSRHMRLDGSVAARIFLEISFGPTVVPLRGPSNRDETGGRSITTLRPGTGVRDAIPLLGSHESDSFSDPPSSTLSKEQSHMPPPILKKSTGHTTPGTRPTARFVSPHSSEDDATESSSDPNGSSHVTVRPPTPEAKPSTAKASSAAPSDGIAGPRRKGHVATTAGHKRRPGIVRRSTTQSSTEIGVKSTQGVLETASTRNETSRRSKQESSEDSNGPIRGQGRSKFQENFSPATEDKVEKTTSKRPRPAKSKLSKQSSTSTSTSDLGAMNKKDPNGKHRASVVEGGPSRGLLGQANLGESAVNEDELDEEDLKEIKLQEALLAEANTRMIAAKHKGQASAVILPKTGHGSDNNDSDESNLKKERPLREAQDPSRISPPSKIAAGNRSDMKGEASDILSTNKGKGRSRESDMFAKRPVQSVSAASSLLVHSSLASSTILGRSKSQLTLLLEQDRAKESNDPKSGNKQTPSQ